MARNQKSTPKEKAPPKPDGPSIGADPSDEQSPFRYLVKGERLRRDGAFFELLLARVILEPGAVNEFDNIWPRGTQALAGLNIRHLSRQSIEDISALVKSVGGDFSDRLGNRSSDLMMWVSAFWEISMVYGSFRQYLRSFDTDGPEALVEDLSKRLAGLTPKFVIAFLRDSGEKIPPLAQFEKQDDRQRGQGRSRGSNRRRGGRGPGRGKTRDDKTAQSQQSQKKQSTQSDAKPDAKPNEKAPVADAKEGNRSRRGRRGIFRNRRGGRGKKPAQQQQNNQAQPQQKEQTSK